MVEILSCLWVRSWFRVCCEGKIIGDRGGGIIDEAGRAKRAGEAGIMERWFIWETSLGEGDGCPLRPGVVAMG